MHKTLKVFEILIPIKNCIYHKFSTSGGEQLRSMSRQSCCRERLLAYISMSSEQGGLPIDTFLAGMHLALVIGPVQFLLFSNEPIIL